MLESPLTREKYSKRMEKFFDFLGLEGNKAEKKSPNFSKNIDGRKSIGFQCILNYWVPIKYKKI